MQEKSTGLTQADQSPPEGDQISKMRSLLIGGNQQRHIDSGEINQVTRHQ